MSTPVTIEDIYKLFQRSQEEFDRRTEEFNRRSLEADRRAAEARAEAAEARAEAERRAAEAEQRAAEAEQRAAEAEQRAAEARAEAERRAAEARAEAERRAAEAEQRAAEARAEAERRAAEAEQRAAEARAEADRRAAEAEARLVRLEQTVERTSRAVDGLNSRWGRFVEELVTPAVLGLFQGRGIDVKEVYSRARTRRQGIAMEIDILVVDDIELVAVECKSRLSVEDVNDFLARLARFKASFPHYNAYQVYGAVAGIEINEGVDRYAYQQGLFVIKPAGNTVEIANDLNFKPVIW